MKKRFGNQRVGFAEIKSNFVPEKSWELVGAPRHFDAFYPDHSRPLFIFSNPFPFSPSTKWKLTELERIAINWWNESIVRHYFLAESMEGERLWVFWEPLSKQWFCHGSFD
jgi:hypothetical protein